jgi:hypothetical protein
MSLKVVITVGVAAPAIPLLLDGIASIDEKIRFYSSELELHPYCFVSIVSIAWKQLNKLTF